MTKLVSRATCLSVLLGVGWTLAQSGMTAAQNAPTPLPLPPSVPSGNSRTLNQFPASQMTPTYPPQPAQGNEYDIQKPQSPGVPPSVPSSSSVLYRVEIKGYSQELLTQVKDIEPLAFIRIGEGVIQAGIFQQQLQAEERVRQLQAQGISAIVIPASYGRFNPSYIPGGGN